MSNARVPPFGAAGNNITVALSVTGSSGGSTVPFDNLLPQVGGAFRKASTVRLYNEGPATVFYELVSKDNNSITAAVGTSIPLPPGPIEKVTTGGATAIVAVTNGGTATLYATPGEGL